MKRPLLICSISMASGTALTCLYGPLRALAAAMLLLAVVLILTSKLGFFSIKLLMCIAIFICTGCFRYMQVKEAIYSRYQEFWGSRAVISGTIVSEPVIRSTGEVYILKTNSIQSESRKINIKGKVRLTITNNKDSGELSLKQGCIIEVEGVLAKPKGRRNPGGFDYRRYLAGAGISALLHVEGSHIRLTGEGRQFSVQSAALVAKHRIIRVMEQSLPEEIGRASCWERV